MRWFWYLGGLTALILGFLGVFLPILPTVPFLILATFCFSRSSPRLRDWLLTHRIYGPSIRAWQERGAISLRAKWLATISIACGLPVAPILGLEPVLIAVQWTILFAVLIFIWTRPSE
jgi:uncharacterized membrane protein YbaN (DUF454 family)